MIVLSCSRRASHLLGPIRRRLVGHALPSGLERSVREAVHDERSVRIEGSPKGPAAYLSATTVEDMAPVRFVVWLRQETVRDSDLARVLRERYQLSARDLRLLSHLRQGLGNQQIAAKTGWAEGTVRTYMYELYDKLEVHSRGATLALIGQILHPEK
jgi:DNA-binding NarL/FixJ family response regulator